jgi:hypothetical protein
LFDSMVEDTFHLINGTTKGEFGSFNQKRFRLPVNRSGDGMRKMGDIAANAYASAVARTAAAGLISPSMVVQYYDGGGGGPPPDGGGGGNIIGDDASIRRPLKRQRLNAVSSLSSSSHSSSSSSSSSALRVSASALNARGSVMRWTEECIEAVHHLVSNDPTAAAGAAKLLPKGRAFWEKFMPFNLSSYASTHPLRTSVVSASASSSSTSSIVAATIERDPVREEQANKAANQLQHKLTELQEEAAFKELIASAKSKEDAVRAVNCTLNGATLYTHIRPIERALELRDFEWRSAIRHKYGLPPVYAANRGVAPCVCNAVIGAGHNHCCPFVSGGTTDRHNAVVGCLEDIMRQDFNFEVKRLPRDVRERVNDGDREKYLIPDLVITDRQNGEQWYIDVSGIYGEAKSHLPNGSVEGWSEDQLRAHTMDQLRARDSKKDRHYAALSEIGEADVIPFVFESHGGLSERAEKFIKEICDYAADQDYYSVNASWLLAGYIRRRVSIAVQRGNAMLDKRASSAQRNSFSARASNGDFYEYSSAA